MECTRPAGPRLLATAVAAAAALTTAVGASTPARPDQGRVAPAAVTRSGPTTVVLAADVPGPLAANRAW